MPIIYKVLIQLLSELKNCVDVYKQEESAKLLATMISSTIESSIKIYTDTIISVLLPILQVDNCDINVSSAILYAISSLAKIAGNKIMIHLDSLIPLILKKLNDYTLLNEKRQIIVLSTLKELIQNTSYVIIPFHKYPSLLPLLIKILTSGLSWNIRKEVLNLFGVIGALSIDEYQNLYHANDINFVSSSIDIKNDYKNNMLHYYSIVSITALIKILDNPSLSQHIHRQAVNNMMFIIKLSTSNNNNHVTITSSNNNPNSLIILNSLLIPKFLSSIDNNEYESSLRELLINELSILITNKYQYIKETFDVIDQYWLKYKYFSESILNLIGKLVLNIEILAANKYIISLIPKLLYMIQYDRNKERSITLYVCQTLTLLAPYLNDSLHLIVLLLLKPMKI